MRTIIYNGILVTMNDGRAVYPRGYVMMEGTKITGVGPV